MWGSGIRQWLCVTIQDVVHYTSDATKHYVLWYYRWAIFPIECTDLENMNSKFCDYTLI